jgi:photosystem II stability/assembly factor-like uncharacterized protein
MPVFRPTAFVLVPAAGVGLAIVLYLMLGVGKQPDQAPAPKDSVATEDSGRPRGPRAPSDWFHAQRAYPHTDIKPADLARARMQARAMRSAVAGGAVWDPVGPTNIGGRIPDLAVHPTDPLTVYVGAAEGGVIKTTNGGATWIPTFDDVEVLSIGDLAIHPTNGDIVYAGTGEANNGGGSVTYGGLGVYKTTNGGATWTNVGLTESRYIGRVTIDPVNPERVFVCAMGALFSTNPERGVYRTTNGGGSWEHVLSVSDSTGAIDLVIDRTNPNRVYAATWERIRRPHTRRYGGPTSAIYRSTNGGDTWSILGGGLPSPLSVNGRIGLAISDSNPQILYAIYADLIGNFAGVYKTTNGGDNWVRVNDGALSGMYSNFGWWFGQIRVDPLNPERVFTLGLTAHRSTTGGASWSQFGSNMHVDHHALEWAPSGAGQIMYEGNDGGLYVSQNASVSWTEILGLPITQFYTLEVDHQQPQRRYGGTQDNGTNRTLTGALNDWVEIFGGDGFYVNVDPTNNSFVYAESQYGNLGRSTNGGAGFVGALNGISGADRMNWSTPVELDPTNPQVMYYGANRLYKSTNRAASWTVISADLSDGNPGSAGVVYGTITTVAAAASNPQVVYAGTDDANVWVTQNGGGNWTRIDAALPERWITRVAVDPSQAATAYVTLSGFRDDDPLAHVFRTTDFGATWTPISSNLPEAPVNDLVIDPLNPNTLYVATDVGVYVTADLGGSWAALGADLPNGVVTDLELHAPTRILTAATYGRSMFAFDLAQTSAVADGGGAAAPAVAPRLHGAAPNPLATSAGPGTRLQFELPRAAHVALAVYDASGRLVRELVNGAEDAGRHARTWDGRNDAGHPVARGTYVVRLAADGVVRSTKVTVSR